MSISNVTVLPGCISCRNCESVCPSVFKVDPTSKVINREYLSHAKEILKAERLCPVHVIKVDKSDDARAVLDEAVVESVTFLTPDTAEIRFKAKDFRFEPGQYVSLTMKDGRGEFTRSYSIVSWGSRSFVLAVKLLPDGRWSKVIRTLEPGMKIEYAGWLGHFVLKKTPAPKWFIATGTGIAPMMAMLRATPEETEKTVVFGVRYEDDLFYEKELASFKNTEVVIAVSRPSDAWKGKTGRVTEHLSEIPKDAEAYVCGNPEMVNSVRAALEKKRHDPSLVSSEEFVAQTAAKEPEDRRSIFRRTVIDGEVPGIESVQWFLIASAFTVPFVWKLLPEYKSFLWDVSWITVVALMCVRPLADIFPKISLFRALIPLRKGLGILSSAVVVTSLWFTAWASVDSLLSTYTSARGWRLSSGAAFARISEITWVLLFVTSNAFSQRILGANWKRLQRLSYAYFFSAGILLYLYGQTSTAYAMALVAGLWIAAEIKKRRK